MSDSILKPYRSISQQVRAVQITPELFELAFSQRATELDGVTFHCINGDKPETWYVRVQRFQKDEWHAGYMGDWIVRYENGWTQCRAGKLFPMEFEAMPTVQPVTFEECVNHTFRTRVPGEFVQVDSPPRDMADRRRSKIDWVMHSLRQRDWDKPQEPGKPQLVFNPFINSILLAYELAENPEKYQLAMNIDNATAENLNKPEATPLLWIQRPRNPLTREQAIELLRKARCEALGVTDGLHNGVYPEYAIAAVIAASTDG